MSTEANALSVLYQRTLRAPDDSALLEELRSTAARTVPRLTTEELEQVLMVDGLDRVPEHWLASVYAVLAAADSCPSLPKDVRAAIVQANEQEENAIGLAFKFRLLERLSQRLTNLTAVFAGVRVIPEKAQRNLRETPSAEAAWPECASLVACGLTPLGVFYATEAVSRLAVRLREAKVLSPSESVVLTPRKFRPRSQPPRDFVDYLPAEFMRVARCGEEAAERLLDWLIAVAKEKPHVFKGTFAMPDGDSVKLLFHETEMNLLDRWTTLREEADVPAEASISY
jgi:hypothetical protein